MSFELFNQNEAVYKIKNQSLYNLEQYLIKQNSGQLM